MKRLLGAICLVVGLSGIFVGYKMKELTPPKAKEESPTSEVASESKEEEKTSPPPVATDPGNQAEEEGTKTKEEPATEETQPEDGADIKEDKTAEDNIDIEFEAPADAPWMQPVAGGDIQSEVVRNGQEGQVSTIWGNGTQGQTELTMSKPRDLQVDSAGNIYFVDGSQKDAKLRMFDGKENKTIVDLVHSKIGQKDGYFSSAGMAVIQDVVYISSINDLFTVNDGRIHQTSPSITQYMKDKRLENIYRIEKSHDDLYIMFYSKGHQYNIARYDTKGGGIEQVIETKPMPDPYNFFVRGDNEIFIASKTGYAIQETIFPRETKAVYEFGDPQTDVADVWVGENESLYMVTWEDQISAVVYEVEKKSGSTKQVVAGSRRGFVDGVMDEAELDYPTDFVWDGTGYIFGDMGNHAIRKFWTDKAPDQ